MNLRRWCERAALGVVCASLLAGGLGAARARTVARVTGLLSEWSAAAPDRDSGLRLVHTHPGDWKIVRLGGRAFASLKPTDEFYTRPTFEVRLSSPAAADTWLVLTYRDEGYGLVIVEGTSGVAEDESGNTRLNTRRVRRAVYRLKAGARTLRIAGLPLLGAVELTAARPAREEIPPHEPAFTLKSPPNLIMGNLAGTGMPDALPGSVAYLHNVLPLVRALGFNGVESYVRWDAVEGSPGVFDWSAYDRIVDECERNGLGWFPLLVIGSSYSMPQWFHDSPENVSFRCLEHGMTTDIPSIFDSGQVKYVRRFLTEFGKHYGGRKAMLGFRLGPTSNYGEAQYPASGSSGYHGETLHTHIGYWVGDADAILAFRMWLRERYATIGELNEAWGGTSYASFDNVVTFLPITARNDRMRVDFSTWYMGAMTDWCERWATWAHEAAPKTSIYQCAGGWGPVEIGTDYVAQTKSMAKLGGGIRMTNENDSFLNDFCVTRPGASAARFYGARFGTEPAGFGCRRAIIGRLYNAVTNNASHLFYYQFNLLGSNGAVEAWIRHAPLLDQRAQPANEIAAFYPDTANRLSDSIMRYLHASQLFTEAKAFRSVTDYDFAGEQMILDGALSRYKVLVFLAGRTTEKPVLARIDAWIRGGGVAIYPCREASSIVPLTTVEGDARVWSRWHAGDTGKGRVIFYESHPEPGLYTRFLRQTLPTLDVLQPATREAIRMQKPEDLFWSVLTTGKLALLNYGDAPATVQLSSGKRLRVDPYTIRLE